LAAGVVKLKRLKDGAEVTVERGRLADTIRQLLG
jgi:hypothetical protein